MIGKTLYPLLAVVAFWILFSLGLDALVGERGDWTPAENAVVKRCRDQLHARFPAIKNDLLGAAVVTDADGYVRITENVQHNGINATWECTQAPGAFSARMSGDYQ